VDVVRDRGSLARIVAGGKIENVYRLQIMNATETTQNLKLSVNGLPGLAIASEDTVSVESTQARWVAVRVQMPFDAAKDGSHTIHFDIASRDTSDSVSEKAVFIVPR
jgi:polyferredoxin